MKVRWRVTTARSRCGPNLRWRWESWQHFISAQRFEEALASYDRALKVRPDFAEVLLNRGRALYEMQQFEEALASYDRALTIRPNLAEALYNRGNALHELKRFEEALASYDRALTMRPDYAEALYNRGLTLQELAVRGGAGEL